MRLVLLGTALGLAACGPDCGVVRNEEGLVRVVVRRADEVLFDVSFEDAATLTHPRRAGDSTSGLVAVWREGDPATLGAAEPRLDVVVRWLDPEAADPRLSLSATVFDEALGAEDGEEEGVVLSVRGDASATLAWQDLEAGSAGGPAYVREGEPEPLTPNGRLDVAWAFERGARTREPEACDAQDRVALP